MSLSGHTHIFHPVERIFDRAFSMVGGQCTEYRPGGCLVFLATETTTQPRCIHFDLMHRYSQYCRHCSLYCGRTLRGRMNFYISIFLEISISALSFDI